MNPTPDYNLSNIPPEVTGAANLVADWMKRNGHTRWELMEICSRNHAAELEQAKRENEALANLLWEHPTAPCDQDSVFQSMERVKQLRADLASAKAKLAKVARVIEAMEKLDDSMTDAQLAAESTLREAIAITVEADTAEQLATAQLRIKLLLLQQAHEESVRAEMKTELIHAGNELERLKKWSAVVEDFSKIREERDQLKGIGSPDQPCDECGVNTLALLKERDQLKAELDRLQGSASVPIGQFTEAEWQEIRSKITSDRDQWRAVADGLALALSNDGMEANNTLSSIARCAALAAYEKQKAKS